MYTLLINDDNTITTTVKERIMERSNLFDDLQILVPQMYEDEYDMTEFTCVMEYILPISRKYKAETLEQSEDLYDDAYVQFMLPFDTKLTTEAGEIEVQFIFTKEVTDEDGEVTETYTRRITPTNVTIVPIEAWSDIVPDEALTAIDQKIIELRAILEEIKAIEDSYAHIIPDDLKLTDDLLQLVNDGDTLGNGVKIVIPTLVDGDGSEDGIVELD